MNPLNAAAVPRKRRAPAKAGACAHCETVHERPLLGCRSRAGVWRNAEPAKAGDSRLAWSLDALECLGFASLMAGRQWTPGDAGRAAELVERARALGLMTEEDPRRG